MPVFLESSTWVICFSLRSLTTVCERSGRESCFMVVVLFVSYDLALSCL